MASEEFYQECARAMPGSGTNQSCTYVKADYFAAQTLTTVGYGTALEELAGERFQRIATKWCFFGATVFSLSIAAAFWFMQVILKSVSGQETVAADE